MSYPPVEDVRILLRNAIEMARGNAPRIQYQYRSTQVSSSSNFFSGIGNALNIALNGITLANNNENNLVPNDVSATLVSLDPQSNVINNSSANIVSVTTTHITATTTTNSTNTSSSNLASPQQSTNDLSISPSPKRFSGKVFFDQIISKATNSLSMLKQKMRKQDVKFFLFGFEVESFFFKFHFSFNRFKLPPYKTKLPNLQIGNHTWQ